MARCSRCMVRCPTRLYGLADFGNQRLSDPQLCGRKMEASRKPRILGITTIPDDGWELEKKVLAGILGIEHRLSPKSTNDYLQRGHNATSRSLGCTMVLAIGHSIDCQS